MVFNLKPSEDNKYLKINYMFCQLNFFKLLKLSEQFLFAKTFCIKKNRSYIINSTDQNNYCEFNKLDFSSSHHNVILH